jgi:high affinity Mn2+ porin
MSLHRAALGLLLLMSILVSRGNAQPATSAPATPLHSLISRVWLSGQANTVIQGHRPFRSPYEGAKSFRSGVSGRASHVLTLYTGLRLSESTSLLFDVERTSGANLSKAAGMAGFPNLDTVGAPNSNPYIARAMVHHSFRLGGGTVKLNRGPLQLAEAAAGHRLEIYAGKFSIPDFFDVNSVGGDSHYQFLNWSSNNNAAYGYPAETRGYTYGILLEYHFHDWAARFAEALQARADNADSIDFNIGRAHSEHFELEIPLRLIPHRVGLMRGLSFVNYGSLALYRDAVAGRPDGGGGRPDFANHRQPRRTYGFGLNLEQELTQSLRAYARLGWNDGKSESRNNTEAGSAVSGGFDFTGKRWRREDDKFGAAFATSALSRDHRAYLALGGIGAVLGDGGLSYGKEKLAEFYYTARVRSGIYVTADVQRIWNPGYNRDRGPTLVAALRVHLEAWVLKEPR